MENKKMLIAAAKGELYESILIDAKAILLDDGLTEDPRIARALARLNDTAKVQAQAERMVDELESTMNTVKAQGKVFDSIMGHFGL